jgi:hydroxymethylbilane synthase
MAQTKLVADALKAVHSGLSIEIVTVSTRGDQDRISPLWKMSGSGFFTTQVEQTLLEDKADIAVHSYKDLPAQFTRGLVVAAVPERRFPEDVLVSENPVKTLDEFNSGLLVGTSSPRRTAQLKRLRPDLRTEPIRGNVETRLSKIREGRFDAVVLARAGLERLNLMPKTAVVFGPTEFIPAPAQGALAVQCRQEDAEVKVILSAIHHDTTGITVSAERRVLAALHPGCHVPVGVFAQIEQEFLRICAFAASLDGRRYIKESIEGTKTSCDALADALVQKLLSAGAADILEEFSNP